MPVKKPWRKLAKPRMRPRMRISLMPKIPQKRIPASAAFREAVVSALAKPAYRNLSIADKRAILNAAMARFKRLGLLQRRKVISEVALRGHSPILRRGVIGALPSPVKSKLRDLGGFELYLAAELLRFPSTTAERSIYSGAFAMRDAFQALVEVEGGELSRSMPEAEKKRIVDKCMRVWKKNPTASIPDEVPEIRQLLGKDVDLWMLLFMKHYGNALRRRTYRLK